MAEVRISAEPRTEFGKGGARRTRRSGRVPAVLYGHGTAPRHISLPSRDFEHALRTDGANVLLSLAIDGGDELALPKAIQRDPVRGSVEHIDLILVRRGEKITVEVAIHVSGDVASGGLLDSQLTTLSVAAEATNIPSSFEVSIDGLAVGRFDADGAIVSTATGSTAYGLSLGGPILHPEVEALVFMPLNPHSLFNRPVVIPERSRIAIRIPNAPSVLICDGQLSVGLPPGADVEIASGPTVQLVQFDRERNFFHLLRQKLRWGLPLIDGDEP